MPITARYQVKCDVCWGVMDGEYDTREEAEAARQELGWEDTDSRTACPEHNTATARVTER
jgi:rubredoxin